jgi:hypothetical protein
VSASSCIAVGEYDANPGRKPLAAKWDGSTWSLLSPASLSGASVGRLLGVSCVSSTDCTAVGDKTNIVGSKTLVEHWDGTSWSTVSSPNRFGGTQNELAGVSCVDADHCYAAGSSIVPPFEFVTLEQFS